jgi:phosphoglycolate phosphatase
VNVFFDLDGTLINSKERVYQLFIDLTKVNISFEDYWDYKKNKKSNESLLSSRFGFSHSTITKFTKDWMDQIENLEYLSLDKLFEFTIHTLNFCEREEYTLYVVTNRQSIPNTLAQLESFGIKHFFKDILITEHKTTKVELIKQSLNSLSSEDIIIGDTGEDINTGKELSIRSIGVLSGFRNKKQLELYKPLHIVKNISGLNKIIHEY